MISAELTSRQLGRGINKDRFARPDTRRCSQIDAVCCVWIEACQPLDRHIRVVSDVAVLQPTKVQV